MKSLVKLPAKICDKTTYPKLLGMEESKKRAFDLVEKAKAIEPWGADARI